MVRLLIIIILGIMSTAVSAEQKSQIVGRVLDASNHSPVSFATIYVRELETGISTDSKGNFIITLPGKADVTLTISALNYVQKDVHAESNGTLTIELNKQSYTLEEVTVMADYKKSMGTIAEINQQALENIQPMNISDALVLTPGGLFQNSTITDFSRMSLRQSGTDASTSLGMAIIQDGMPTDNDGIRSQIVGLENDEQSSRSGLNLGTDLRSISTDHLQKIEIIKGISSAKIGNLSSGVIQTTSKIGATPLQVRLKMDPLNKLVYAGKGFKLSEKAGSIHLGVDYADSYADRRDPLDKYTRLTGQLAYNNTLLLGTRTLSLFGKLSESYTLNQAREDELTTFYGESFKNKYSKSDLMLRAHLYGIASWIDNMELVTNLSYTYDLLDRTSLVQTGSPQPQQTATQEGEQDGKYLPSKYYSTYQIENKPLNWRTQLNMESLFNIGNTNSHLIYGLDYRLTKNYGEGAIVDMTKPPFPDDNKFVRPRANYDIPALNVAAAYIEEQLLWTNKAFDLNVKAGIRTTKMLNLDATYTNLRKVLAEPRVNVALSRNFDVNTGTPLKAMLRLGFGQENKLPTLDYIYPDKVYKDLIVLNAYISQDSPYNHLITDTRVYDPTNYELEAVRSNKLEAEFSLAYNSWQLSIAGFHEYTRNGYETLASYNAVNFIRYIDPVNGTISDKRPEKSDYYPEEYGTYVDIDRVSNTANVDKKGIEYSLKFPKIRQLASTIEINGAYYITRYTSTADATYFPTFRENNKTLPYVAYYSQQDETVRRQFNTNVWINTNIPSCRLIFTTFVQCLWTNDEWRNNGSSYPYAYMSTDGMMHEAGQDIQSLIANSDVTWRHYYLYKENYEETLPVSITVNFKVAKELGNHIKAAFFVNNLLNVNPKYKNRYNQQIRTWTKASFGAELSLSL